MLDPWTKLLNKNLSRAMWLKFIKQQGTQLKGFNKKELLQNISTQIGSKTILSNNVDYSKMQYSYGPFINKLSVKTRNVVHFNNAFLKSDQDIMPMKILKATKIVAENT